ncbi:hypothetical protein PSTT_10704 [Puccinia striiformis]|uniref:RRM domain-containing protein n=1 Tax=Puccinia striiformis TaxID=27350 RepID=A0A2S4V3A2_9BASI|nr:hypothetical protein PSTT_10704 [Puccinia striiformis]
MVNSEQRGRKPKLAQTQDKMTTDIVKDPAAAPTANGTDGVAAITEALEVTTIQELGRKVGCSTTFLSCFLSETLALRLKDDQLREVFGKHGEISDVQIIHRGTRSLGYGFVTFFTCEDPRRLWQQLTKPTSMDVPLRYTRRRSTTCCCQAAKASKARPSNGEAKSGDEDPENPTDPTVNALKAVLDELEIGDKAEPVVPLDLGAATDASTHNGEDPSSKPRSKRTRTKRPKAVPTSSDEPNAKDAPREKALQRENPVKRLLRLLPIYLKCNDVFFFFSMIYTTTTELFLSSDLGAGAYRLLFVANLPFEVTDEKLKEFFSTFKVVSAHVVCRKFGTTVGRSKGFGFVDFEDQENQLKALEELQGKEIEGRAVSIKIAVNENKKEEEENAGSTEKKSEDPTDASVPAEPTPA